MADSYLDHVPSHEQRRLKRMMSTEAYEKLRENVKGPEDLKEQMEKNARMADVKFSLETDPQFAERAKENVEKNMREQGMEAILERVPASAEAKKALEQGKFKLTVSAHPKTHNDQLMVLPEGNVQEKFPIKPRLSEQYAGQLLKGE